MLEVVTRNCINLENKSIIADIELAFDTLCDSGEKFNASIYNEIIKVVDKAARVDDNTISTIVGTANIKELSIGCKTCILVVFYKDEEVYISVDECGSNAIDVIVELSKTMHCRIFTQYTVITNISSLECTVDEAKINTGIELYKRTVNLDE